MQNGKSQYTPSYHGCGHYSPCASCISGERVKREIAWELDDGSRRVLRGERQEAINEQY